MPTDHIVPISKFPMEPCKLRTAKNKTFASCSRLPTKDHAVQRRAAGNKMRRLGGSLETAVEAQVLEHHKASHACLLMPGSYDHPFADRRSTNARLRVAFRFLEHCT